MKKTILAAMVASLAFVTQAAEVTTQLNVSAQAIPVCSVSTTPVDFGAYAGTAVTSSGTISVTCSNTWPYNIALDAGMHFATTFGGWRFVANEASGSAMPYGLYKPGDGEWGDIDFANTYAYGYSKAGVGTGAVQTHVVDATLFAWAGLVVPGTYTDVVNVTVHY